MALVCALAAGGPGLLAQNVAAGYVALQGSVPAWANQRNLAGSVDTSAYVGFRVYLNGKDPEGAEALARAVSDPESPAYGAYLDPAQYRARFSPLAKDVDKVRDWLKSQGFKIVYVPANSRFVSAEGTLAQAQEAFGIEFATYQVKGKTVRSPTSEITIPVTLRDIVHSVIGLDESFRFIKHYALADSALPPTTGTRNSPPLSAWWGQYTSNYQDPLHPGMTIPWVVKGYTPRQIREAYQVPEPLTGKGQTVVVIDAFASPSILGDVNLWSLKRGLPTMNNRQLKQVVPPGIYEETLKHLDQDPQGWWTEETLDIEAVHGIAPQARIVYVGAANADEDLDAAMNHVVDDHLGQIVTNSYGYSTELLPPAYIKAVEAIFIQGAAQGIGIYFSSGDSGDEYTSGGYSTPDWPAVSPWVTAVGGTTLAVGVSRNRLFETGWGTANYNADPATFKTTPTGWLYGSGGAISKIFARPYYQAALNVTGRGVPDVSALGDPQSGFRIGQTQSFVDGVYYGEFRIGGTSLSCPIFAGLMALSDQCSRRHHGFANPVFYAHPWAFFDVTSHPTAVARRNFTNNENTSAGTQDKVRTIDDYSGSPTQRTTPGWDDVTGLGSPKGVFPY